MDQSQHAKKIADRFRDIVQTSGDTLSDDHYDELVLLVEAGLDSALLGRMEHIADRLTEMAEGIRHDAEFFNKTDDK